MLTSAKWNMESNFTDTQKRLFAFLICFSDFKLTNEHHKRLTPRLAIGSLRWTSQADRHLGRVARLAYWWLLHCQQKKTKISENWNTFLMQTCWCPERYGSATLRSVIMKMVEHLQTEVENTYFGGHRNQVFTSISGILTAGPLLRRTWNWMWILCGDIHKILSQTIPILLRTSLPILRDQNMKISDVVRNLPSTTNLTISQISVILW